MVWALYATDGAIGASFMDSNLTWIGWGAARPLDRLTVKV